MLRVCLCFVLCVMLLGWVEQVEAGPLVGPLVMSPHLLRDAPSLSNAPLPGVSLPVLWTRTSPLSLDGGVGVLRQSFGALGVAIFYMTAIYFLVGSLVLSALIGNLAVLSGRGRGVKIGWGITGLVGGILSSILGGFFLTMPGALVAALPFLIVGLATLMFGIINLVVGIRTPVRTCLPQGWQGRERRRFRHGDDQRGKIGVLSANAPVLSGTTEAAFALQQGSVSMTFSF